MRVPVVWGAGRPKKKYRNSFQITKGYSVQDEAKSLYIEDVIEALQAIKSSDDIDKMRNELDRISNDFREHLEDTKKNRKRYLPCIHCAYYASIADVTMGRGFRRHQEDAEGNSTINHR
jgi:hypothetical protein